ncbi:uncharacterized protein LOC142984205 [Anticarsia gemmatalis]|uniref:uncharacterized protein LOC142984205 n=1 Tax=Anticarsia gemmatalis TaxID=129554 RepID=UPI003F767350
MSSSVVYKVIVCLALLLAYTNAKRHDSHTHHERSASNHKHHARAIRSPEDDYEDPQFRGDSKAKLAKLNAVLTQFSKNSGDKPSSQFGSLILYNEALQKILRQIIMRENGSEKLDSAQKKVADKISRIIDDLDKNGDTKSMVEVANQLHTRMATDGTNNLMIFQRKQ